MRYIIFFWSLDGPKTARHALSIVMESLTYKKSGVDIDRAERILADFTKFLATRPKDKNVLSGIGGFSACYDLKAITNEMAHPILISCCDGVGTKAKLALEWDLVEGLGNDLVAMNVNDLICSGAIPLIFLDYYAVGTLDEKLSLKLLKSIQTAVELAKCTLIGGETAEMPGIYSDNDFDLAGFSVGIVDKQNILGPNKVRDGDELIALESSGLHSNGYSLIRKLINQEKIDPNKKTSFNSKTWKETLLCPTTIYVPFLDNLLPRLNSLAHITGGGLLDNLPRVLPAGSQAIVNSNAWNMPSLFKWIQEKTRSSTSELLRTFNCGVGMIAVCDKNISKEIILSLEKKGMKSWKIGHVEFEKNLYHSQVIWT